MNVQKAVDPSQSSVASGGYMKVCTNSISVMGESRFQDRTVQRYPARNRVVVILEDNCNDNDSEEDKVEVIVMKTKGL